MFSNKKGTSDKLVMQNAAKTLLANIRFASVDTPIRSLVITSSVPNEGKTTVTINLAQAIATSGKRVLVVEADMRRRSVAAAIGVHAKSGIYSVLSDQVPLEQAVIPTNQQNMSFLDAEPHIPNPADIIASKRFARLVDILEDAYDYVLFDTPPVGTFVDAAVLATQTDATAMVIRDSFAKRDEILHAYEQLKKAEVNIIGLIMNYCEIESSEYYYAYYNKDGKRVRTSAHASGQPEPKVSAPEPEFTLTTPGTSTLPARRGRARRMH